MPAETVKGSEQRHEHVNRMAVHETEVWLPSAPIMSHAPQEIPLTPQHRKWTKEFYRKYGRREYEYVRDHGYKGCIPHPL